MIGNIPPAEPSTDGEIDLDNLDRDRQLNRLRLKNTFEDIFTKYECDFSNVGDEIDLDTEEVIVDNGHLSGMLDEHDVGRAVADQCLRCLATEPSEENERDGVGEEGEEEEEEGEEGTLDEENSQSMERKIRSHEHELHRQRKVKFTARLRGSAYYKC